MKKRSINRMLGVAVLSGVLFASEVFVTYGAHGNSVLEASDRIDLETGQNADSGLVPFETYMKECWDDRQERIDISAYGLTEEEWMTKLSDIRLENPEYWWASKYRDREINTETGVVETHIQPYSEPNYGRPLYRKDELEREWEIVQAKTKDCKTDLEKAVVVHEHLVDTVDYSIESGDLAHQADGAIFEKQAVCEGYSLAYKYYMNRLGIPCNKMSGLAGIEPHGWNQVQLDGEWYLVDPTWGDPEGNNHQTVYHTYLLCSENKFGGHTWDKEKYERCTDTTYDNVPWRSTSNGICGYQGGLYYVMTDIVDGKVVSGIWRWDAENPSEDVELVLQIDDKWPVPPGDGGEGFSEIAYYDGLLYYSTPRAVWKWNFDKEDAPEKVFELEENIEEVIWNVEVADGIIYYETALSSKGYRQKLEHVIDPDYQKAEHPIEVTDTTMTVDLNSSKAVLLQSAAPGAVTYESENPDICDVEPVYKDESCQLIPKKTGRTVVTVSAEGTDHYLPGSREVEVIVKDSSIVEENIILNYEAGSNGTVQAKNAETGDSLADGAEITPNTEVEFTAVPDEGYLVKNWIVNGAVYEEDGETYIGTTLKRNISASTDSVKVEFVKEDSGEEENIILNYEAGSNGTVQAKNVATGDSLADGAEVAPNTEVEFTAVPDEGYLVKNWIVNGGVYEEDGETYTGTTLKRNIAASTDSVKVEFVKEEPKFIRGDVDLNGKVDIGDLRLTLRYVCQKTELDETQKLAGDVAAGEGVDIADLRKILRYVCKKIDEL